MTTRTRTLRLGFVARILAGVATSAVAARVAAALNAPGHIVHGKTRARVEAVTACHTLVGFLVNMAATVFRATLFGRVVESPRHRSSPAAIPCVTDYATKGG